MNRVGTGSGLCLKKTLPALTCRVVGSRQGWGSVVGGPVTPVVEPPLGVS